MKASRVNGDGVALGDPDDTDSPESCRSPSETPESTSSSSSPQDCNTQNLPLGNPLTEPGADLPRTCGTRRCTDGGEPRPPTRADAYTSPRESPSPSESPSESPERGRTSGPERN
jgi:hypothetical protein